MYKSIIFFTAAAAIALLSKIPEIGWLVNATIWKGRCRYEMFCIYQPPNVHERISRILLSNAMQWRRRRWKRYIVNFSLDVVNRLPANPVEHNISESVNR
jgi:hypothetical protein